MDVVNRAERFDDLAVRLILLKLFTLNGERNRVNAKTGIDIRGVYLDIVDSHAKLTDGSNEALEVFLFLKLKMDFKMIGAILEMALKAGEEGEADHHSDERDKCNGVESRATQKTYKANGPKSCRSGKTLDLALGAEKDGVGAENRDTNDNCSGNKGESNFEGCHKEQIKKHTHCGSQGNKHKGTKTCGMTLGGALPTDNSGEENRHCNSEKYRPKIKSGSPLAKKLAYRIDCTENYVKIHFM